MMNHSKAVKTLKTLAEANLTELHKAKQSISVIEDPYAKRAASVQRLTAVAMIRLTEGEPEDAATLLELATIKAKRMTKKERAA